MRPPWPAPGRTRPRLPSRANKLDHCRPRSSQLGVGEKGIEAAVFEKIVRAVNAAAGASGGGDDEDGGRGRTAPKKDKMSRAEKKEKKKGYGR